MGGPCRSAFDLSCKYFCWKFVNITYTKISNESMHKPLCWRQLCSISWTFHESFQWPNHSWVYTEAWASDMPGDCIVSNVTTYMSTLSTYMPTRLVHTMFPQIHVHVDALHLNLLPGLNLVFIRIIIGPPWYIYRATVYVNIQGNAVPMSCTYVRMYLRSRSTSLACPDLPWWCFCILLVWFARVIYTCLHLRCT